MVVLSGCNWLLTYFDSSLTRQLPFNVPFSVKVDFIERCFDDWEKHCLQCFDAIHRATEAEIGSLAVAHRTADALRQPDAVPAWDVYTMLGSYAIAA